MGKVQGGKAGFVALFLVLAGLLPGCEKGNLMVLLAPPEAVDAGAQWNVDGGDWLDSGATIKKIKAGEHVIGFKPVEGWIAPEDRAAVVVKKKTLTENGVYLPIEPEGEGEPSEAMVPNVAGMSQSNALLALQEAGLLAEIAVQCSMTAAEGTILGQAPPAETVVEVGSTVTLFVSSGPCTVMVPDVTGQNETAANTAMAEAGLAAGPSVSACDDTVPAGNVIGQTPAPGAEVEAGTVVLLTVSSGPCGMNAPDVTGLQQPAAEAAITGAGAVVGLVARQCDAVLPLNTVISQSPAAGAPMSSGGRMDLVVSSGPCNGQIPNVVGLSETDAAALIAAEGFAVSSPPLTQCSLTVAAGSVTSQQPAGGTSATLGSTVTLTVSSGPCTIAVPNVVGQTQAAATAALTGAGLTAGAVTNQCSNTVAAGRVISQTPAAGAVIVPGTAVALTVSTGPCNVTVPNVVGQTQA
ncbi:MAG: PASTA domain-containing protein, partial [Candidatus Hydrogenedentes bacterium]|nr:PASTA domain-containing protein [Candidatus Hydrogenedentota bacterium]